MEIREPVGSVRVPEEELLRLVSAVFAAHRADMSTGQVFALYAGWQVRSMTMVLGVINDVLRGAATI
jgi:hypothetical protein